MLSTFTWKGKLHLIALGLFSGSTNSTEKNNKTQLFSQFIGKISIEMTYNVVKNDGT